MTALRLLPAILSCVLMAAHVLRMGMATLAVIILFLPLLFLLRRAWVPLLMQGVLALAALEWLRTALVLARGRIVAGEPWMRMIVILAAVVAVTVASALLLEHPGVRRRYEPS